MSYFLVFELAYFMESGLADHMPHKDEVGRNGATNLKMILN